MRIALTIVWILIAGMSFGQNWPSFRGPHATGVADSQNLPIRWDGPLGENILWKVPIMGLGHSSPVVWGERIYLTMERTGCMDTIR